MNALTTWQQLHTSVIKRRIWEWNCCFYVPAEEFGTKLEIKKSMNGHCGNFNETIVLHPSYVILLSCSKLNLPSLVTVMFSVPELLSWQHWLLVLQRSHLHHYVPFPSNRGKDSLAIWNPFKVRQERNLKSRSTIHGVRGGGEGEEKQN